MDVEDAPLLKPDGDVGTAGDARPWLTQAGRPLLGALALCTLAVASSVVMSPRKRGSVVPARVGRAGGAVVELDAPDNTMQLMASQELTRAEPDDVVEVSFLESPLMFEQLGGSDVLAQAGFWHSGVGFKNTRTGLDTTVQFYASQLSTNIIVPKLDVASHNITWDNAALVACEEGQIVVEYWTKIGKVATITGADFNAFITDLLPGFVGRYTRYWLFNLAPLNQYAEMPHLPGKPAWPGQPPGATICHDVAEEILESVAQVAGHDTFDKSFRYVRDDVYLWMDVEKGITGPLDMTPGSTDFEEVWEFYTALGAVLDKLEKVEQLKLLYLDQDQYSDGLHAKLRDKGISYAIYTDSEMQFWKYYPATPFVGVKVSREVNVVAVSGECSCTVASPYGLFQPGSPGREGQCKNSETGCCNVPQSFKCDGSVAGNATMPAVDTTPAPLPA